jgi:hypothetical protein
LIISVTSVAFRRLSKNAGLRKLIDIDCNLPKEDEYGEVPITVSSPKL